MLISSLVVDLGPLGLGADCALDEVRLIVFPRCSMASSALENLALGLDTDLGFSSYDFQFSGLVPTALDITDSSKIEIRIARGVINETET